MSNVIISEGVSGLKAI